MMNPLNRHKIDSTYRLTRIHQLILNFIESQLEQYDIHTEQ